MGTDVAGTSYQDTFFASGRDDWATPEALFQAINARYGPFDHDVAAQRRTRKVQSYLGPDHPNPHRRDALRVNWYGNCWCNPPYGRGITEKWVRYGWHQAWEGHGSSALLVPSRTSAGWFNRYVLRADRVVFLIGRVSFDDFNSAPFDSLIAIFNKRERNPDGTRGLWDMNKLPIFETMYVPKEARYRGDDEE